MLPRTGLALLLLALPALGADLPREAATPKPEAPRLRLFGLFPELHAEPAIHLDGSYLSSETLRIRQPGDPDSVVSPGEPGPSHELRLLPAIEINDLLLKAYTPDPTLVPGDNRFRAAGAYSPLDTRRPYQFRLGARLVW